MSVSISHNRTLVESPKLHALFDQLKGTSDSLAVDPNRALVESAKLHALFDQLKGTSDSFAVHPEFETLQKMEKLTDKIRWQAIYNPPKEIFPREKLWEIQNDPAGRGIDFIKQITIGAHSIRVAAQVPRERAGEFFFEKHFDSLEAFDEFKKLCDNKKRIGFFGSLVIPVRTDNLNNFSKDFFFPTLVNHAMKINNTVLKLIASIVCAAIDICTLPIRAITAIPRYFYNAAHTKETHPLYQHLKQNGVNEEKLSTGHVYLEMQRPEQTTVQDGLTGTTRQEEKLIREGETFNFVELPKTVSEIQKVSGWIHGKDYSLPYFL